MEHTNDQLEFLLTVYKEGANDVRTKADQYAKLWLSMFSVVGVLYAISTKIDHPGWILVGTPALMTVWLFFICYTHATMALLLHHVKAVEAEIVGRLGGEQKEWKPFTWYGTRRELIHKAGGIMERKNPIDWLLLPLLLISASVYLLSCALGVWAITSHKIQLGDFGSGIAAGVYITLSIVLVAWPVGMMLLFLNLVEGKPSSDKPALADTAADPASRI